MFRIAWDGRGLVGPRTGIGWYTHHLIRGFEALLEEWSADLYLNHSIADTFSSRVRPRVFTYANTVRLRGLWENMILPWALHRHPPDVWHSPLSVVPKKARFARVATIHDVAFLRFPHILPREYRKYWTKRIKDSCRNADLLIAVSEATRSDVLEFFRVDPSRVTVVHEAADPFYHSAPSPEEVESVRRQHNLPGDFFLFVGTLEPRKNLSFLLDVYEALLARREEVPTLAVAGGKGWLQSGIGERLSALGDKVRPLGYLERGDLRALYAASTLVMVPSLYEGFGLQAAEAMACGAVVLASDVSSLPEVVGEGGLLLPIDGAEPWVDKILELVDNPSEAERLRRAAVERARHFSWEGAAVETFAAYRRAVDLRG